MNPVWEIRISAVVALLLLAGYAVLRAAAGQCSGAQCDAYIVPSLAVPLAAVAAVGVTGGLAIYSARHVSQSWLWILVAATAVGVLGPPVALAIFRDQPDSLVFVASVLLVQGPVAALVFTISEKPQTPPA
jgi:hypothetical protein